MDKVNNFVRSLWKRSPSPPRSFSVTRRGNVLRRRASSFEPMRPTSPTTQAALDEDYRNKVEERVAKLENREPNKVFSFKKFLGWEPTLGRPPRHLPMDHLPSDMAALDGLINHHLAQVESLKRELKHYNRKADQFYLTYLDMVQRAEFPGTTEMLKQRIQGLRNARNLLARFVQFHLQELERVIKVKQELGSGRPVPNVSVIRFSFSQFFPLLFSSSLQSKK